VEFHIGPRVSAIRYIYSAAGNCDRYFVLHCKGKGKRSTAVSLTATGTHDLRKSLKNRDENFGSRCHAPITAWFPFSCVCLCGNLCTVVVLCLLFFIFFTCIRLSNYGLWLPDTNKEWLFDWLIDSRGSLNWTSKCYLPPGSDAIPVLTPTEANTRSSEPGGMRGWVDLVGWLLVTHPKTVIRPSTNRARRWLTLFARRTPLTSTPRRLPSRVHNSIRWKHERLIRALSNVL